jgi:hypothetical protein
VPATARPLRQVLQSMDTRERAVEADFRAGETAAPAAQDRTGVNAGRGFTGMESILNFFFWQALAINPFDNTGHFLRVIALKNECASYSANPDQGLQDRCGAYLGPYQPGVNAPDPTNRGGSDNDTSTPQALEALGVDPEAVEAASAGEPLPGAAQQGGGSGGASGGGSGGASGGGTTGASAGGDAQAQDQMLDFLLR